MLHDAERITPAAIAFLQRLEGAGNAAGPNRGHRGRPHRLDDDLTGRHQVHRLIERRPERPELAGSLDIQHRIDGLVDLCLRHVSFVVILDVAAGLHGHGHIDDTDRRIVLHRGLALEVGAQQIRPAVDFPPDQVGADAQRVAIRNGRDAGQEFGLRAAGHLRPGRVGGIQNHGRRDALLRCLAPVRILTLGEQRHRLVPVFEFRQRNGLQHVTPDQIAHIRQADVGAVDGAGLRQEAVQQISVFRCLHLHRKPQILGRLLGDRWNRGHRRTGMMQHHVLDVLRPDGREAGDRVGSDGRAGGRQKAAAREAPGAAGVFASGHAMRDPWADMATKRIDGK